MSALCCLKLDVRWNRTSGPSRALILFRGLINPFANGKERGVGGGVRKGAEKQRDINAHTHRQTGVKSGTKVRCHGLGDVLVRDS
jgi:hypothetical protein